MQEEEEGGGLGQHRTEKYQLISEKAKVFLIN
jgi:hypothetical protein